MRKPKHDPVPAAELKGWRERHGWTAVVAAAMLNTPFDTYRGWEKTDSRAPGVVKLAMQALDTQFPLS